MSIAVTPLQELHLVKTAEIVVALLSKSARG